MKYIKVVLLFIIINSCKNLKDENKKNEWTQKDIAKLESIAHSAYLKNQYSNTVYLYSKLISLDSTKGEYYFNRAYSYSMLQNTDSSIQDYLKSIKTGYKISKSYQNIGGIYFAVINNDSLAVYYYSKSLEYDPENIKVKMLLEESKKHLTKD